MSGISAGGRHPISGHRGDQPTGGRANGAGHADAPGRRRGGLIIIRREKVKPFTRKQIALLRVFADQAAMAIDNARLFNELQVRNRDLTDALEQQTATAEILRVISTSPADIQPVMQAMVENARASAKRRTRRSSAWKRGARSA